MQTLQSNPLLPITPQSLQLTYCPTNCRTLANPFPPNPLANAGLTLRPNFHSCINSTPVSRSETRHLHPAIPDRRPDPFVGPQRRDHGNQSTHSRFDESISVRRFTAVSSPSPPIRFSYPSHTFFLLWKFLFPFDASFPVALPLHCC